MADDPARARTGHDHEPVSLRHGYEVRHWCRVFGCTESALRAAVAAVGSSAPKVREFLAKGEPGPGGPLASPRRTPGA